MENSYWLYLEPYVYVDCKEDNATLVNTLDSSIIRTCNPSLVELINNLLKPDNSGVCFYQKNQDVDTDGLVENIRQKFMGDLIPITNVKNKPIQFIPQFNYAKDVDSKKEVLLFSKQSLYDNIREVTLFLNGECDSDCSYCDFYYRQVISCTKSIEGKMSLATLKKIVDKLAFRKNLKVNLIGVEFYEKDVIEEIITFLYNFDMNFQFITNLNSLNKVPLLIESSIKTRINVDLNQSYIQDDINILNLYAKDYSNIEIVFLISSNNQIEKIKDFEIKNYHVLPFFDMSNYTFFDKYVSITESSLLEKISKRQIILNKLLNTNFWGRLFIVPCGDVFSNINSTRKLGNIEKDSLNKIVKNELYETEDSFWLKTRNNKTCSRCSLQFICPPPSNYEIVLKKDSLCKIFK